MIYMNITYDFKNSLRNIMKRDESLMEIKLF